MGAEDAMRVGVAGVKGVGLRESAKAVGLGDGVGGVGSAEGVKRSGC